MNENTENFDKKKFDLKVGILGLLGLAIGLVGIISIILSISLPVPKGKDPADYYATYYTCDNYEYRSFEFEKGVCHYTESNGTHLKKTDYTYDFVSAAYANSVLPEAKYKDRNAILVYQDDDRKTAITLWVKNAAKNNYTFEIDANGAILTTKNITMSDYCGDTKNYYGRYEYGANYLELNLNKTAKFYYNGETLNLKYLFVNDAWLKKYYEQNDCSTTILLYSENNNTVYSFGITGNGSLKISNLIFNRVASIEPPADTEGGNSGGTPSSDEKENDSYKLIYELIPYTGLENVYAITGIEGNPESITIPKKYNNIPVIYIFENVFANCTNLTSVEFEKTANWYVSNDGETVTTLSESYLQNPVTAATYLTKTFLSYLWINYAE